MASNMDDRTYRNIMAAVLQGRAATGKMARQPGVLYPGTPEEQAQLQQYAEAVASGNYASVDNIEKLLGGKR